MQRTILTYPNPLLKRKAAVIPEVTDEIRQLAADMVETMYESDGIGLAAPQVGEAIRLITVDVSGPERREELLVLVNPELELLGDKVDSEEGCLSVEDFRAAVVRSEKVRLKAQDLEGNSLEREVDGLLAICLQHECDHLEGTLFIDRISRLKRNLYDSKVKKWARKNR